MTDRFSHEADLQIDITLQPTPPKQLGFGRALLLAPASNNSTNLRTKVYRDAEAVGNDWTTAEQTAATVYFSQNPQPDELQLGEVDVTGNESYADGLDAVANENGGFYGVAMSPRTSTEQEDLSSDIEGGDRPVILKVQNSSDEIVAGSLPGSTDFGSDYDTRERSFGVYHPNDSEWADLAWLGRILPYDPDIQSTPFYADLSAVAEYAQGSLPSGASIGSQQSPSNLRDNNWNALLDFSSSSAYLKPGTNFAGRQGKVIITRDWFRNRLQTDVALTIDTLRRDGEGIPVGEAGTSETVGQIEMAKLVEKWYGRGAARGHFLPLNINIEYPQVTSTQVSNGIIPLDAQMTVLIAGQAVTFGINFTRNPV